MDPDSTGRYARHLKQSVCSPAATSVSSKRDSLHSTVIPIPIRGCLETRLLDWGAHLRLHHGLVARPAARTRCGPMVTHRSTLSAASSLALAARSTALGPGGRDGKAGRPGTDGAPGPADPRFRNVRSRSVRGACYRERASAGSLRDFLRAGGRDAKAGRPGSDGAPALADPASVD
jgi:hypothetical protein